MGTSYFLNTKLRSLGLKTDFYCAAFCFFMGYLIEFVEKNSAFLKLYY